MNKRTKEIFKEKKKQNWKPLIYASCCFIIFLFIWVIFINSGSDEPSPGTLTNIQREKQAVEELKSEVYTQEHDNTEGVPSQGLQNDTVAEFMQEMAPGIGAFIIILGVFSGVATMVYAMVGMVRR